MIFRFKNFFLSTSSGWSYFSILFAFFCTQIYSIINYRNLLFDNGEYLFRLFLENRISVDSGRFFSAIHFLPSYLFIQLYKGVWAVDIAILLNGISLHVHHFFSLGVSYILLKSKNKESYFIFPLMSFVAVSMMNMSWVSSQIHDATSIFWPLLIFALSCSLSFKNLIFLLIGSTCLALTHPSSLCFDIVLALVLIFRANREASKKRSIALLGGGIFITAFFYSGYSSIQFDMEGISHFFYPVRHPYSFFGSLSKRLFVNLAALISLFLFQRKIGLSSIVIGFFVLFAIAIVSNEKYLFVQIQHVRILEPIVITVLSFAFCFLYLKNQEFYVNEIGKVLLLVCTVLIWRDDLLLANQWKNHVKFFKEIQSEKFDACHTISTDTDEYTKRNLYPFMLKPTQYVSMLLSLDRNANVKSVVYTDVEASVCQSLQKGIILDYNAVNKLDGFFEIEKNLQSRLNFEAFLSKADR